MGKLSKMFKSSKEPVISMLQYLLETSSLRHVDLAFKQTMVPVFKGFDPKLT